MGLELSKLFQAEPACTSQFLKLLQYFNCIHFAGGYPVEPLDIHPSVRHLDCLFDKLTLTDKVAHAYALGPERIEDVMEMVRIAGGLSHADFDATSFVRPMVSLSIQLESPSTASVSTR